MSSTKKIWVSFRNSRFGNSVRALVPQSIVNLFWHMPMAVLAVVSNSFPAKGMVLIGVTGTDGKTTTTNMIYHILKNAGYKVSVVSTVKAVIGDKEYDTGFHVTSPHPSMVQRLLREAKDAGSEVMVFEVSSSGLDQHRFLGLNFNIGVVTNITHEHLDYHKSWENYFKAKAKLVKNAAIAVLNYDEKNFKRLASLSHGKVISYGLKPEAEVNPKECPLNLDLPGDYNLQNAMAASAVAMALGVGKEKIIKSLESFRLPMGRMQEVANDLGINIYIDYAHTPNGLEQALTALEKKHKNKLIALIGAEGLRDVQKRAWMGKIAGNLADITIVTAVDPRGYIDEINKDISKGLESVGGVVGKTYFVESDRQKAIEMAIKTLAKKGDTVGIFGKGHENSMNLDGKEEIPWSDLDAVKRALKD